MSVPSRRKSALPRDLLEAVYETVHTFGADHLARLTDASPTVILNKANPNATTPHLPTLCDALTWQLLSKDHRILHTMARILGEACFPIPDLAGVSDEALLEHLTRIGKESGEFHCAIADGLKDKNFTAADYARVEREGYQLIGAIAESLQRMKGLIDG